MLVQTKRIMEALRVLNKSLDNALRINPFVDEYVNGCIIENKPVTIITPWSLSKSFESRHKNQGDRFVPTNNEIKLFKKEIPNIELIFKENGLKINWWIIFSRSYITQRVISRRLEMEYVQMVSELSCNNSSIVLLNWEDDVLNGSHIPNKFLLDKRNFEETIKQEEFIFELERWKKWAKEIGLPIAEDELAGQTRYQIACEAEEGRFLMESHKNPLCEPGEFIFVPLGRTERYIFFSSLNKKFQKRIVAVLKPYPWRL